MIIIVQVDDLSRQRHNTRIENYDNLTHNDSAHLQLEYWPPRVKDQFPKVQLFPNLGGGGVHDGQLLMLSPNLLRSQIPYMVGGRGRVHDGQLLMLSPNLLRSQIPYMVGGGGGLWQPTFDAESKSAKIPNSLYGGWGGRVVHDSQLLMLSPNLLRSQIPYMVGGGGVHDSQLLMLSPNLLRSQIPYMVGGGGGGTWRPTFDAESKSARIPNSLYGGGGGGGIHDSQLLMLSPNLLRSQIPYMVGGGGGGTWRPTFDAESKAAKIPNSLYGGGGGGGSWWPTSNLYWL